MSDSEDREKALPGQISPQTGTKLPAGVNSGQHRASRWTMVLTVMTGMGLFAVGLWLLWFAYTNPEPPSKVSTLITGGVILVMAGGGTIVLAINRSSYLKASAYGIHVEMKTADEPNDMRDETKAR